MSALNAIDPRFKGQHPSIWCPRDEDKPLQAYGYRCGCYAKVYLDRQLMNPQTPTEPFDVNSIATAMIEAVEWYAGPAQLPPELNKLNSVCGVLVIHTRRSR
ncbi:MAG: hypothetical protein WD825_06615 [Gemmatimonadaceae bacterium]